MDKRAKIATDLAMASIAKAAEDLAHEEEIHMATVKQIARLSTAVAAKQRAELEPKLSLCRQKIQKLKTPAQRVNILTKSLADAEEVIRKATAQIVSAESQADAARTAVDMAKIVLATGQIEWGN